MSEEDGWKINEENVRQILENPDSSATVLHVILLKTYGMEYVYGDEQEDAQDPLVMFADLEDDYKVTIPPENENRINAILLATATEAFFYDKNVFSSICIALRQGDLGDTVNGYFEKPTLDEVLTSVMEVRMSHGEETEFSETIETFVKEIVGEESSDSEEEGTDDYSNNLEEYKQKIIEELKAIGMAKYDIDYFESYQGGLN